MTNKQLLPTMLLVTGLVLTILATAPISVLSAPPDVKSKVQTQSQTEGIPDGKGGLQGTKTTTTTIGGVTTVTERYTAGPNSGTTVTMKFGASSGTIVSSSEKRPDGSIKDSVYDAAGGKIVTTTRADGSVGLEKYSKGGGGADVLTASSVKTTYPNGTVATHTIDASTGKTTGLTIKDPQGKVTTAVTDGKGGFTSAITGDHGKVATSSYDKDGKLTSQTLTDEKGKIISTTAITADGKGGYSTVTTDKKGKIVGRTVTTTDSAGGHTSVTTDTKGKVKSTTVYDSTGKVLSQSGAKPTTPVGLAGQSSGDGSGKSGKQTSQGIGKHKTKQTFQTEVFQKTKAKSHDQDWGSFSGSSGSSQKTKETSQNQDFSSSSSSSGSSQSHHRGRR